MKRILSLSGLVICGWLASAWPTLCHGQVLQQTFSENLAEFSISTPNEKWHFTPRSLIPGPIRATLRFQSPVDQFVPNVTVRITAVHTPQTNLKELIEEDLKSFPPEIEILSQNSIKHGPWDGYEIQMRDPKSQIRFLQWIFLAKEKNFLITGAVKESAWPRLEEDIKKILNSFQIR